MFTKDVLQIIVDLIDGECDLFLLPRVQRFLNMANFPLKLLSQSKLTICPFSVSTHLNCCSFGACGRRYREGSRILVLHIQLSVFCLQFLSCAQSNVLTPCSVKDDEISLILDSLVFLLVNAPFFFASPKRCDFVPNVPSVVPAAHVFPPRVVIFSYHLSGCFKVLMTAFVFVSQAHSIALHILSAITSDRIGSFIFVQIVLAILAVLV